MTCCRCSRAQNSNQSQLDGQKQKYLKDPWKLNGDQIILSVNQDPGLNSKLADPLLKTKVFEDWPCCRPYAWGHWQIEGPIKSCAMDGSSPRWETQSAIVPQRFMTFFGDEDEKGQEAKSVRRGRPLIFLGPMPETQNVDCQVDHNAMPRW